MAKLDQLSDAKRRMKRLEHGRAVEAMIEDRRRRRAEEMAQLVESHKQEQDREKIKSVEEINYILIHTFCDVIMIQCQFFSQAKDDRRRAYQTPERARTEFSRLFAAWSFETRRQRDFRRVVSVFDKQKLIFWNLYFL